MDNLYTSSGNGFNNKLFKLIILISVSTLFFHAKSYAQTANNSAAAEGDNDIIATSNAAASTGDNDIIATSAAGSDNDIIASQFAADLSEQTVNIVNVERRDVTRIEIYNLSGQLLAAHTPGSPNLNNEVFSVSLGASDADWVVVKIFTEDSVIVTKMTVD